MLNSVLRLFGKTCKFVQIHDALNKAEVFHPRSSFPLNGFWSQDLRVSRPLVPAFTCGERSCAVKALDGCCFLERIWGRNCGPNMS